MLADPKSRGARQQLRRPVAAAAQSAGRSCRTRTSFPTSTTTCGRPSSARPSCSSTASCARIATSLDLLTADYTFVNERLARHYGIPNVYGSQFRRVHVTDETRKGLLGQGSILAVTSHADADVAGRARQVDPREHARHAAAAAAARCAGPQGKQKLARKPRTMREQMAEHRANPACASCHKMMDPIGFALENFDAVGAWRTREARRPIDASGELADGTDGGRRRDAAAGAAATSPRCSSTTMTEKLLTYALGRGLDDHDMPAVRRDRPRVGAQQLPLLVVHSRHRQERAVSRCANETDRPPRSGRDHRPTDHRPAERLTRHVHHQDVAAPPDVPARRRRDGGPAASRRDGSRLHRVGRRPPAHAALRRGLRAQRRHHGRVDPDDAGHGLRAHADPEAARARSSDSLVVVSNLTRAHPGVVEGDHAISAAGWLTGVLRQADRGRRRLGGHDHRPDRRAGRSDRTRRSRRSSSRPTDFTGYVGACTSGFSCVYTNTISWSSPTTPLPMEINPRAVFERMFGRPGSAGRARAPASAEPAASSISIAKQTDRAADARSARATAPGSTTTWTTSARSSGAFSGPRRATAPR